jgi:hypothetical protein
MHIILNYFPSLLKRYYLRKIHFTIFLIFCTTVISFVNYGAILLKIQYIYKHKIRSVYPGELTKKLKTEAFPIWETRLEKIITIFPSLRRETGVTKMVIVFLCVITILK